MRFTKWHGARVFVAVVALTALALLGCSGDGSDRPETASPPGTATVPTSSDSLLVYSYTAFDQSDIFRISADGSELTNLTDYPGTDVMPAVSPDGRHIAFVSSRDGEHGIYVMDADGSESKRVTEYEAGTELSPSWSPNAEFLLFSTDHDRLDTGDCCSTGVYRVNADGSDFRRLASDAGDPDWSPEGAQIAFVCSRPDGGSDICVMDSDGASVVRLTDDPDIDTSPNWSPDGGRIAFTTVSDGTPDMHLINPNGTGRVNVTRTTAGSAQAILLDAPWSPDGERLAFVKWVEAGTEAWVVEADGSNTTLLAPAPVQTPRWSPDGATIALIRPQAAGDSATQDVFLVEVGGTPRQLTIGGAFYFDEGRLMLREPASAERPLGMTHLGVWDAAR